MEIVKIQDGKIAADLASKVDKDWYKQGMGLGEGTIDYARIEVAINTGKPELRIMAPVYLLGKLRGLVVLSLNIEAARALLAERVYGKTGYPYLVND